MNITIDYYYCFIVFVALFSLVHSKVASYLLFVFIPVILILLKTTGLDYYFYKIDYESGEQLSTFPFFYTSSQLTAEPFYKIYSAFIRVLTGLDFEFFLAINFLICMFILFVSFPFKANKKAMSTFNLFVLFMMPVILPTLFYFSPRSSISFFLILSGFFLLIKNQAALAFFLAFLGSMIHSQFILFVCFLFISYFFAAKGFREGGSYKRMFLIGIIFIIFLEVIPLLISYIAATLSFLPSASVAVSKLHYISTADEGMRVTSILSLGIFPLLNLMLYKNQERLCKKLCIDIGWMRKFTFFITICTIFGFCINFSFFNMPHLSGRLGRFSDYFLFSLLLPLALLSRFSKRVVLLFLVCLILLAPVLYGTVYSVHDNSVV